MWYKTDLRSYSFSPNASPETLDFDDVKLCCGNSKGITPSEIMFYSYPHSEMWKTICFCCYWATTATSRRHHILLTANPKPVYDTTPLLCVSVVDQSGQWHWRCLQWAAVVCRRPMSQRSESSVHVAAWLYYWAGINRRCYSGGTLRQLQVLVTLVTLWRCGRTLAIIRIDGCIFIARQLC